MSAKKAKKSNITPEKLALYEKLIDTHSEVERKGGNNPYTALNGNMFTYMDPNSALVAIRLPGEEREKFLKKYKTKLFEAYGAVMKEYVTVPDSLLAKTGELKKYLVMSYEYAKTLKAKPSRKK
jgi:hypothetical protein